VLTDPYLGDFFLGLRRAEGGLPASADAADLNVISSRTPTGIAWT